MEKENWVNEVMNSTVGMQRAEVSPFLYQKITSRINSQSEPVELSSGIPAKWTVAFLLLLAFNGVTLLQHSANKKTERKEYLYQQVSSDLNFATTYNY